jgi:hypothetical protein
MDIANAVGVCAAVCMAHRRVRRYTPVHVHVAARALSAQAVAPTRLWLRLTAGACARQHRCDVRSRTAGGIRGA